MLEEGLLKVWKNSFGFIARQGKPDLFIYVVELRKAGFQGQPAPGIKLLFNVLDQPGGRQKAVEVELVDG